MLFIYLAGWIEYSFEIANLKLLVICLHRDDIASIRVLEKLGFSTEDDWLEPATVLAFLDNSKIAI